MKKEPIRSERQKNFIMYGILFAVFFVVIVGIIIAVVQKNKNTQDVQGTEMDTEWDGLEDEDMPEKWQEGVVSYNGKRYIFNTAIDTYLFMGIDHDGPVEKKENQHEGGQSDANFLLVVDNEKEKISVIAINRNTMTDIEMYDQNGYYLGTVKGQLCLQHGYGDGMRLSCTRAVDAVSRLFYNLPISGYLSLNMGALPVINDAVGGVTVEVLEDIYWSNRDTDLKKGETVTLTGNEAYSYLRYRQGDLFDSATMRLERQKQYINALIPQAKAATGGSLEKVMSIYEDVEKYMVTNIDFANLAEEVIDYGFDSANMYSVKGETIMGETYEEHYVDDDALYELILEVFYKEVTE